MKHKPNKPKVLFVLKFRQGYDQETPYSYGHYFSSGLYWSAKFVVSMLLDSGIEAKLVQIHDNNGIDREVHKFRPDVVVIEALWVVPEKFDVLKKLHPNVQWIVRLHSNMPFLAQEGIAIEWIKGYAYRSVLLALNEERAYTDVASIIGQEQTLYLPNYYPVTPQTAHKKGRTHHLHIGCYGAVRPLKNQLEQAVAAIRFADETGRQLFFHINSTRVESGGDPVLKNLQALFKHTWHTLVQDSWMNHKDFLHKLQHIEIGMQASLSETFSIVAADMVNVGIPIVVSPEIGWAFSLSKVDPTDSDSIVRGLQNAEMFRLLNVERNRYNLKKFSHKSREIWLEFLEGF